ncbi:MAG: hypothetical protein IJ638_02335 [Alphaproteobacteria bacterium]|nr:hypothetical protein [Alphaproteobacteria bacterium]
MHKTITYNTYIAILNTPKVKRKHYDAPDLEFLRACKHFLDGSCQSTNWGPDSPCWKCLKQGKYDPKNADKNINAIISVESQKCR